MSLYTRNKERCTDLSVPAPRMLAVAYWPRRGELIENEALNRIDLAALDVAGLVEDAFDAIRTH